MKELINISFGSNVAQTKQVKETKNSASNDDNGFQNFLSLMFSNLKNTAKTAQNSQNLQENILQTANTNKNLDLKGEKKELDEHSLIEILEVISLLKNETPTTNFPKYSTKIESLLKDENALKDFKNVKNIADLMQLSKKYDLGLEKLSIKKTDYESLQKEFPNLVKNGFFEIPKETKDEIKNTFLDTSKKTEIKSSEIPFNAIEKPVKKSEKEQSIFEKIITKEKTPKTENKDASISLKNQEKNENKETKNEPLSQALSLKNEKKETKQTSQAKQTIETNVKNENTQNIVKEMVTNTQKEKKDEKDISLQAKDVQEESSKELPKTTRVNEVKLEGDSQKRGLNETVLHEIKKEKNETTSSQTLQSLMPNEKSTNTSTNETVTDTETKIETHSSIKNETKIAKPENIQKQTTEQTRDTFSSFSNDLKEKLEQYKPPIVKVQMALNPKSLGEVDVTIINRGSNLHVSITSNTNTMSLFMQNQAEFKNSLVNMGFTNLEMNFSDQRQGNQNNGKNGSSSNTNFSENLEDFSEEINSLELIVPQYV